ncbi:hypothetical protein F4814DRAFT_298473 [Daldinia grandis]|nr:hypothetical protein F4814DRAFT_298473 [Daldinia grandis]
MRPCSPTFLPLLVFFWLLDLPTQVHYLHRYTILLTTTYIHLSPSPFPFLRILIPTCKLTRIAYLDAYIHPIWYTYL